MYVHVYSPDRYWRDKEDELIVALTVDFAYKTGSLWARQELSFTTRPTSADFWSAHNSEPSAAAGRLLGQALLSRIEKSKSFRGRVAFFSVPRSSPPPSSILGDDAWANRRLSPRTIWDARSVARYGLGVSTTRCSEIPPMPPAATEAKRDGSTYWLGPEPCQPNSDAN